MTKTAATEFSRLFLIERLPEPLTSASSHIQIFDNYVSSTRIRLRKIRDPYAGTWTRVLQQRFTRSEYSSTKFAEIYLNEDEYAVFKQFEGREIRKNRYFHEFDRVNFIFDVYLGNLWGLNTAKVDFSMAHEMENYEPPPFAIFEITNDPFFFGENLVEKKFSDIQAEVVRLGHLTPVQSEIADE
jgi:CYTH domain-containing protein